MQRDCWSAGCCAQRAESWSRGACPRLCRGLPSPRADSSSLLAAVPLSRLGDLQIASWRSLFKSTFVKWTPVQAEFRQDFGLRTMPLSALTHIYEVATVTPLRYCLNHLTSPMMDVRRNAWFWMAAAFCASLGVSRQICRCRRHSKGHLHRAPAIARLASLIFWSAYAGGAVASLFGRLFSSLRALT